MSELNKLKVVDFTAGRLSSDDINTNIPFAENFDKTRTIQQANAVIGAYVNRNYVDMQNKANKDEIPTKVSELDNDVGYITTGDIPTKTSQLENDSGFITSASVPTKVSELDNDSGFITKDVNDLTNYTTTTVLNGTIGTINTSITNINTTLSGLTNYSLNEQVIGTWYNSKPLYRKVFVYNSTVSAGWSGIAYSTLGISNIDYLRVVSALGKSSSGQFEEMTSHQNRVIINTPGEALSLYLTDSSIIQIIFILEYTKTTD